MSRLRPLLLLILLLPAQAVLAEAMVLLQGYLGDDDPWRRSGAASALLAAGWVDGGHLHTTPTGVRGAHRTGGRTFYTVALPTEAPLMAQLRALEPLLQAVITRHPGESLTLVGHSAGGVLARLYMVQHPQQPVATLITIASPHLGTASAEAGLMAGESPLGWFAPLMGADSLLRSRPLFHDLAREQRGNLLFWLNRQPHPPARYVSVIRQGVGFMGLGDMLVPDWSQDMNSVAMLRGRSRVVPAGSMHPLGARDGQLLLDILRRLRHS